MKVAKVALASDPISEFEYQWRERGWDSAAPGVQTVMALFRSSRLLSNRIDLVLRPLDLTFARYKVLMTLSFCNSGALPIFKIGDLLQVDPSSISSAMDRLVISGFAERIPDREDGRVVHASITKAGKAQANEGAKRLTVEVFERLGISDPELQQLRSVLRAFRLNAGDSPLLDSSPAAQS